MANMKTTGDLRKKLSECFDKLVMGELTDAQIRGVVGVANQINISLHNEQKTILMLKKAGESCDLLGEMKLHNKGD